MIRKHTHTLTPNVFRILPVKLHVVLSLSHQYYTRPPADNVASRVNVDSMMGDVDTMAMADE